MREKLSAILLAAALGLGLGGAGPASAAGAAPAPSIAVPSDNGVVQVQDRWDRRQWRGDRRDWRRDHRREWRGRDDDRRWRRHHHRHHRPHYRPRPHIEFWYGGPAYRPPYYARPPVYAPRRHVRPAGDHYSWCASRYRSYRAYDNTFQPYYGPRRQCVSPFV
ncbi:BA14K family protein [Aquamicrobium sp. LC103]|uniref:BA14K family protein n=1 Tax=Aquamicrobium sp. LC103 TaxID=1120658 RepID=UPI0009E2C8FB|nr:BA14K family protein [Aquamicrobium sp. LC103]TKT80082.1 BA14K family protein [Aquamicrobium sp. LC103]